MLKIIHFHCNKSIDVFARDVLLHESEYVERHPACLIVDTNNWKHADLLEMAERSAHVYQINEFHPEF